MNIIKELENLKEYCLSLADYSVELTSFPPQHYFSHNATVESVISEINSIIQGLKFNSGKNEIQSFAAEDLRAFIEETHLSSENRIRLLEIANLIDNEFDFTFYNQDVSIIRTYIDEYLKNGGSLSESFLKGLFSLPIKTEKTLSPIDKLYAVLTKRIKEKK